MANAADSSIIISYMPHVDSETAVSPKDAMAPAVNGEPPSSAFLSHLCSYPVVNDSIQTFKSIPLGKKSLSLADHGFNTFAKPVLPYFYKPYQYVSPYVAKADSLGDGALTKVEAKFPAVKKPTNELYDNAAGLAFLPLRKGLEGRDYVVNMYKSEVKKVGGEGLVSKGKAAVTTTLIVSSDALSWLSNYLSKKEEQTKDAASDKLNS